jgi:hypothetical protein
MAMAGVRVENCDLDSSDLHVGATYEGGPTLGHEPISKLTGTGNQGGIRPRNFKAGSTALIALFSTETQVDWPDVVDTASGTVTYFGDNREPGKGLIENNKNRILHQVYQGDFESEKGRLATPLFFVFRAAKDAPGRSVIFEGIAVPGSTSPTEDWCIAKWFSKPGGKFQNYQIQVTLLADRLIRRSWVEDLVRGDGLSSECPPNYRHWLETGIRTPLCR